MGLVKQLDHESMTRSQAEDLHERFRCAIEALATSGQSTLRRRLAAALPHIEVFQEFDFPADLRPQFLLIQRRLNEAPQRMPEGIDAHPDRIRAHAVNYTSPKNAKEIAGIIVGHRSRLPLGQ